MRFRLNFDFDWIARTINIPILAARKIHGRIKIVVRSDFRHSRQIRTGRVRRYRMRKIMEGARSLEVGKPPIHQLQVEMVPGDSPVKLTLSRVVCSYCELVWFDILDYRWMR